MLGADLGEDLSVVTGVVSAGLSTIVLPAGERRADLPDRHHHRVVPGRDLADDADRLAADHRGVALEVLAGGAALEVAGGAGEEAQVVDHERDLVLVEGLARLAGVGGLEVGDLLGALLDRVGELQQRRAGARPGVVRAQLSKASLAASTARVDVLLGRQRRRGDHLAGRRIDHVLGSPSAGVDELAADEVLQEGAFGLAVVAFEVFFAVAVAIWSSLLCLRSRCQAFRVLAPRAPLRLKRARCRRPRRRPDG